MNPFNLLMSSVGLKISRINPRDTDAKEKAFIRKYDEYCNLAERNSRGFKVLRKYRYEAGNHPVNIHNLDTGFAAYHISRLNPSNILEIGSFRQFIIGLLAHYNVTSLDIRDRKSELPNETVVTYDAKALKFSDGSFDVVLSLGALPHFGLCRYGDEFDLDGDIKAFNEMIRVLKPGGHVIFSAAIMKTNPTILFNAERVYNYAMIKAFCKDLELIEEKFIDRRNVRYCLHNDISTDPYKFDYYVGCWKKGPKE